ncbi:MAG: hypothetical protein WC306_03200 [Candidatus Paceibacterota bacterium]|jgi:hypothetical protein
MPATSWLVKQLAKDFPQFSFKASHRFLWSPSDKTIFYNAAEPHANELLLHELAHGILKHNQYRRDIELITIEQLTWEYVAKLSPRYQITINKDFIHTNLDSYRDWLHIRSTCPSCTSSGLQTTKTTYQCLACGQTWRVNNAKTCALRRYKL